MINNNNDHVRNKTMVRMGKTIKTKIIRSMLAIEAGVEAEEEEEDKVEVGSWVPTDNPWINTLRLVDMAASTGLLLFLIHFCSPSNYYQIQINH